MSSLSSWQPIETAPRDGTPVDLWNLGGGRETNWHWHAGWWRNAKGTVCGVDGCFSHWIPLPEPPQ